MVATPVDLPPFRPDVCLVCSLCTCLVDVCTHTAKTSRRVGGQTQTQATCNPEGGRRVGGHTQTKATCNPEGGRRVGGQTRTQATCNPGGGRRVGGETRTQTRTQATCNPGGGRRVGGETRTQATWNPGGGDALVGAEEGTLLKFQLLWFTPVIAGNVVAMQGGCNSGRSDAAAVSTRCTFILLTLYVGHSKSVQQLFSHDHLRIG